MFPGTDHDTGHKCLITDTNHLRGNQLQSPKTSLWTFCSWASKFDIKKAIVQIQSTIQKGFLRAKYPQRGYRGALRQIYLGEEV